MGLYQQQWTANKQSIVLVILALSVGGCATVTQTLPQQQVLPPPQPIKRTLPAIPAPQAVEAAPPVYPVQPNPVPRIPAPIKQPDPIVAPASKGQPAVKTVLLKVLNASKPNKQPKKYTVQSGDTLTKIASRHHVTLEMLKLTNQVKTDLISVGQVLLIPAADLHIEIDKSENRLRLFNDDQLIRNYPVATGDQGLSPVGSYTVANRLIQPTWYWQGVAVTKDDPDYPIGTRWLGLSKKGYGIHGTNEPASIGKQASHGCVRMHNVDVEELFEVVPVGTKVKIVE